MDPYLRLMDPYLRLMDRDSTPFFSDFKSFQFKKFDFLLKFCVKILFGKHYFSPLNTFVRKGKDPDPGLWLMDPDLGGPKNMRIRIPNTA
jgi:hypothetical protein